MNRKEKERSENSSSMSYFCVHFYFNIQTESTIDVHHQEIYKSNAIEVRTVLIEIQVKLFHEMHDTKCNSLLGSSRSTNYYYSLSRHAFRRFVVLQFVVRFEYEAAKKKIKCGERKMIGKENTSEQLVIHLNYVKSRMKKKKRKRDRNRSNWYETTDLVDHSLYMQSTEPKMKTKWQSTHGIVVSRALRIHTRITLTIVVVLVVRKPIAD